MLVFFLSVFLYYLLLYSFICIIHTHTQGVNFVYCVSSLAHTYTHRNSNRKKNHWSIKINEKKKAKICRQKNCHTKSPIVKKNDSAAYIDIVEEFFFSLSTIPYIEFDLLFDFFFLFLIRRIYYFFRLAYIQGFSIHLCGTIHSVCLKGIFSCWSGGCFFFVVVHFRNFRPSIWMQFCPLSNISVDNIT